MSDSTWTLAGWVLTSFGGVLILWGWLGGVIARRRRTRRRCPKCWYDLSHTPGLVCSECGHAAKRERHLYRCRRRWWPAALGVLLLIAAYAAHHVPETRANGWEAAVPTTAIIMALPAIEARSGTSDPQIAGATFSQRLAVELDRRCQADDLPAWQWTLLIERILRDDPARLLPAWAGLFESRYCELLYLARKLGHLSDQHMRRADAASHLEFDMARRWPPGAPVFARILTRHWDHGDVRYVVRERGTGVVVQQEVVINNRWAYLSSAWGLWPDQLRRLATATPGTDHLGFDVEMWAKGDDNGWRHVRSYAADVPIEVTGSIEEYVRPVRSDALDTALRSTLQPTLRVFTGAKPVLLWLEIEPHGVVPEMDAAEIGLLAVKLDVLDGDEIVATGVAWWFAAAGVLGDRRLAHTGAPVRLDARFDDAGRIRDRRLTLRMTGDPHTALRDRHHTTCWSGQVSVPLSVSIQ